MASLFDFITSSRRKHKVAWGPCRWDSEGAFARVASGHALDVYFDPFTGSWRYSAERIAANGEPLRLGDGEALTIDAAKTAAIKLAEGDTKPEFLEEDEDDKPAVSSDTDPTEGESAGGDSGDGGEGGGDSGDGGGGGGSSSSASRHAAAPIRTFHGDGDESDFCRKCGGVVELRLGAWIHADGTQPAPAPPPPQVDTNVPNVGLEVYDNGLAPDDMNDGSESGEPMDPVRPETSTVIGPDPKTSRHHRRRRAAGEPPAFNSTVPNTDKAQRDKADWTEKYDDGSETGEPLDPDRKETSTDFKEPEKPKERKSRRKKAGLDWKRDDDSVPFRDATWTWSDGEFDALVAYGGGERWLWQVGEVGSENVLDEGYSDTQPQALEAAAQNLVRWGYQGDTYARRKQAADEWEPQGDGTSVRDLNGAHLTTEPTGGDDGQYHWVTRGPDGVIAEGDADSEEIGQALAEYHAQEGDLVKARRRKQAWTSDQIQSMAREMVDYRAEAGHIQDIADVGWYASEEQENRGLNEREHDDLLAAAKAYYNSKYAKRVKVGQKFALMIKGSPGEAANAAQKHGLKFLWSQASDWMTLAEVDADNETLGEWYAAAEGSDEELPKGSLLYFTADPSGGFHAEATRKVAVVVRFDSVRDDADELFDAIADSLDQWMDEGSIAEQEYKLKTRADGEGAYAEITVEDSRTAQDICDLLEDQYTGLARIANTRKVAGEIELRAEVFVFGGEPLVNESFFPTVEGVELVGPASRPGVWTLKFTNDAMIGDITDALFEAEDWELSGNEDVVGRWRIFISGSTAYEAGRRNRMAVRKLAGTPGFAVIDLGGGKYSGKYSHYDSYPDTLGNALLATGSFEAAKAYIASMDDVGGGGGSNLVSGTWNKSSVSLNGFAYVDYVYVCAAEGVHYFEDEGRGPKYKAVYPYGSTMARRAGRRRPFARRKIAGDADDRFMLWESLELSGWPGGFEAGYIQGVADANEGLPPYSGPENEWGDGYLEGYVDGAAYSGQLDLLDDPYEMTGRRRQAWSDTAWCVLRTDMGDPFIVGGPFEEKADADNWLEGWDQPGEFVVEGLAADEEGVTDPRFAAVRREARHRHAKSGPTPPFEDSDSYRISKDADRDWWQLTSKRGDMARMTQLVPRQQGQVSIQEAAQRANELIGRSIEWQFESNDGFQWAVALNG